MQIYQSRKARHRIAAFSAGPIFLIGLALFAAMLGNAPVEVAAFDQFILAAFSALIASSVVGTILSILPIAFGRVLLMWIGRKNVGLRHPAIWGLTGGFLAWSALIAFDYRSTVDDPLLPALMLTGTCCALLCRMTADWEN